MKNKKEGKLKPSGVKRLKNNAIKVGKVGVKAGIMTGKIVKETLKEEFSEDKESQVDYRQKGKEDKKSSSKDEKKGNKETKRGPRINPSVNLRGGSRGIEQSIEAQLFSWYGWVWSLFTYMMIIAVSFMISAANPKFFLLPIGLIIFFPFYLYWMIINTIPQIKIGSYTLFSRHDLSVKSQLNFTRAVIETFSREMFRNSPIGGVILVSFFIFFVYIVISPFVF